MVLSRHPTRSKQLPVRQVLQLRLLWFFSLSESITTPVRYDQHPAIICPLTIPNRVGYVRCRDYSALGWFNTQMVILTCFVLIISLWLKPRNRFTGFKNPYRLIKTLEPIPRGIARLPTTESALQRFYLSLAEKINWHQRSSNCW